MFGYCTPSLLLLSARFSNESLFKHSFTNYNWMIQPTSQQTLVQMLKVVENTVNTDETDL